MNFVYHYTPAYRAALILRDGYIWPSTLDLTWWSSNPRYENTATVASPTLIQALGAAAGRPTRFALGAGQVTPWRSALVPATLRRKLDTSARKRGAHPHEWFVTSAPVPVEGLRVEQRIKGAWREVCPGALGEQYRDVQAVPDNMSLIMLNQQSLMNEAIK